MSRFIHGSDGRDYIVEEPADGCAVAFGVIALVFWGLGKLLDTVNAWLNGLYESFISFINNWLLAFHFSNVFETLLHLYIWVIFIPIIALFALALGGLVGGIIFGFWSGHRLTLLVPFGEGGWNTLGKILVWLVLVGLCLCISGGIGLFGIFFPVLKVIHFCWEMICLFKDKCLKMSWCNNVVFGIAVYLIIPVLLLVGFLVTRSPQA